MPVVLQHHQTEGQYLKCGSAMLLYKIFKTFCGRNYFVYLNTPIARKTFLEVAFHVPFRSLMAATGM